MNKLIGSNPFFFFLSRCDLGISIRIVQPLIWTDQNQSNHQPNWLLWQLVAGPTLKNQCQQVSWWVFSSKTRTTWPNRVKTIKPSDFKAFSSDDLAEIDQIRLDLRWI